MNTRKTSLMCICFILVTTIGMAQAGPVQINSPFGTFTLRAKSLKEMSWDTVIRQQFDFSCGSAAVATLLTYHYNRPTTEAEVFEAMVRGGDRRQIQTYGFSMLDMKRYLDSQGLDSDGFKMSLDDFIRVGMPAITLVNTGGYKHFVVVKGFEGDDVLIGDPAVGTVTVPVAHFAQIWGGAVLGARQDMQLAKRNFNNDRDWKVRPKSPLTLGVDRNGGVYSAVAVPGQVELGK